MQPLLRLPQVLRLLPAMPLRLLLRPLLPVLQSPKAAKIQGWAKEDRKPWMDRPMTVASIRPPSPA